MGDGKDRRAAQAARLLALGRSLTDEQWNAPSLCDGWQVRHVFAHVTWAGATPLARALAAVAKALSIDGASNVAALAFADRFGSKDALLAATAAAAPAPIGLGRVIPATMIAGDLSIHELDIRHAFVPMPGERFDDETLRRLLDFMATTSTPMVPASRRARGLRLVATDVDWSRGAGPLVEGPAEHLVLALAGRRQVLPSLQGDGVATLAARIGAA